MSDGLVSVIIPAYDCARYLGAAVESVFRQSYSPVEIIVVDDGSTDDPTSAVARFGDAVRMVRQEHAGTGAARNHGVRMARGEILAFLDADDLWVDGMLRQRVRALEDLGAEMVFGYAEEFLSEDLAANQRSRVIAREGSHPCPTAPTLLIRRVDFERVGPFAEDLRVAEWVDWYARATETGLRGAMLPAVLLRRRLHATNTGITERAARPDYVKALKNALDRRRSAAPTGSAHTRRGGRAR